MVILLYVLSRITLHYSDFCFHLMSYRGSCDSLNALLYIAGNATLLLDLNAIRSEVKAWASPGHNKRKHSTSSGDAKESLGAKASKPYKEQKGSEFFQSCAGVSSGTANTACMVCLG